MTDAELVATIARIIRTRPRVKKADRASAEARDLARYDQIAGLITRHQPAEVRSMRARRKLVDADDSRQAS